MGKWEQFEAFVAVVDHQGFTAAARGLAVAKSALSRRVNELEQRLGVRLLNRTTRRLSLTTAGEQLYQQIRPALSDVAEIENQISCHQLEIAGRIRLSIPLSFGLRYLTSLLSDFLDRHPAIELDIDLNDRSVDLVAEAFDMVIRIGELADSSLIARKLGSIDFVTVASPSYLEINGEPQHPSELKHYHGLIYANVSSRQQWQYVENGQMISIVPAVRVTANNGDILARMAIDGQGLINVPRFLVDGYIESGELIPVLREYQCRQDGLYAVFPPGRMIPRRLSELADFIRRSLQSCSASQ